MFEMQWELDAAREAGFDEGYEKGRVAAIADMQKAADLQRVEALVNAAVAVHDALFKVVAKRFPTAKQSELKTAMRAAVNDLKVAVFAFRNE